MAVQLTVCEGLRVAPEDIPRGCRDAAELLDDDDPVDALRDAGYP